MRRVTRLTNTFSKKIDNFVAMIGLFHMHYNFARIHQSLRVTPAMEAGLSQHVVVDPGDCCYDHFAKLYSRLGVR